MPNQEYPQKVHPQLGTNWKWVVNDLGIWLSIRPQVLHLFIENHFSNRHFVNMHYKKTTVGQFTVDEIMLAYTSHQNVGHLNANLQNVYEPKYFWLKEKAPFISKICFIFVLTFYLSISFIFLFLLSFYFFYLSISIYFIFLFLFSFYLFYLSIYFIILFLFSFYFFYLSISFIFLS